MTREWVLQEPGRPLNTTTFESHSHTGTLLSGLNALRAKGHLLDVTLIAQGEAFKAHRVVLASVSDYFRAMFTDAMRESRQSEIGLNGVSAAGMRLLLDYAYTSRLPLNLANIQDVLSAASHIQVVAVVEACSNYLQSQLDLENCVDIATISETYSLGGLRSVVYRFMCGHFVEFSRSADFLRLHPQQLEHLLACDFPIDCPEVDVLRITLRWMVHTATTDDLCQPSKRCWASRLLRRIHFSEIGLYELEALLCNTTHDDCIMRLVRAEVLLPRHIRSRNLAAFTSPLVNSRGMELAIVKENIHPFGFRYSPRTDAWTTLAPMQRERCRFSLNVVGVRLLAVGGASEGEGAEEEGDSACELYVPQSDCWESVTPLPGFRTQHAAAAIGAFLYVSGGLDRDVARSSMFRYDSALDVWEPRASLLTPRADHAMVAVGGRSLYACGGWFEDAETGNRVLVETIDRYDVGRDAWETVTRVPTPRYHAGIVPAGDHIYFIGGFHSDAMFDRATAVIECYDLETDTWTTGEKYPQDIWEHTCATLYIPRCRDDMEVLATPS